MKATYDVIVVGGGLSGPAGSRLSPRGRNLDVLLVEANSELASFCCTFGFDGTQNPEQHFEAALRGEQAASVAGHLTAASVHAPLQASRP